MPTVNDSAQTYQGVDTDDGRHVGGLLNGVPGAYAWLLNSAAANSDGGLSEAEVDARIAVATVDTYSSVGTSPISGTGVAIAVASEVVARDAAIAAAIQGIDPDMSLGSVDPSGGGYQFPGGEKNQWIHFNADGSGFTDGQVYRCNVDGTAANTPANWTLDPVLTQAVSSVVDQIYNNASTNAVSGVAMKPTVDLVNLLSENYTRTVFLMQDAADRDATFPTSDDRVTNMGILLADGTQQTYDGTNFGPANRDLAIGASTVYGNMENTAAIAVMKANGLSLLPYKLIGSTANAAGSSVFEDTLTAGGKVYTTAEWASTQFRGIEGNPANGQTWAVTLPDGLTTGRVFAINNHGAGLISFGATTPASEPITDVSSENTYTARITIEPFTQAWFKKTAGGYKAFYSSSMLDTPSAILQTPGGVLGIPLGGTGAQELTPLQVYKLALPAPYVQTTVGQINGDESPFQVMNVAGVTAMTQTGSFIPSHPFYVEVNGAGDDTSITHVVTPDASWRNAIDFAQPVDARFNMLFQVDSDGTLALLAPLTA